MSKRPSILLVDDRGENLVALGALLAKLDAHLLPVRSGREALELLLIHEVAVALVDVQMPEMDGFELAELMRGTERTREIPIIFVTAGLHDQARLFKGYEAGAVDFLLKPLDPRVLSSKMEVFLKLWRQRQQLEERVQDLEDALCARARAEQRFRTLFTTMTEGFALHEIVCDLDGTPQDYRFLDVNPAFERLTGLARENVIGRLKSEVLPEDDSFWIERYGSVALTGQAARFDRFSVALDRHFDVYSYRPAPFQFAALYRDVTELKRVEHDLRESESKYRSLAENLPSVLVRFDGAQNATYLNSNSEELTGRPAATLLGKHLDQLGLPDDLGEVWRRAIEETLATGEPQAIEIVVSSARGARTYLLRFTREASDGADASSVLGIATDITEVKRVQDALEDANAQLREANRRKNEFLAVLSHELRNPLAPIKNSLYILSRVPPGGRQAMRSIEVIGRQADQLSRLVDDLLDVTRITRNKITLQRELIDLAQIVRQTTEDQRSLFEQSGLRLELELPLHPVPVCGDAARIAQVVANLLHNAAKFTRPGGTASVKVTADDTEPGHEARIRVRDTGVGMDKETLDNLFQPFMQADSSLDRSKGGLGLGLALVKGLVELHGGRVRAYSEGLGRGCEFEVSLPMAAKPAPLRDGESARSPTQRRRILLIEDNLDAAETMRAVLELMGHTVSVAHDGRAGLTLAKEQLPELILCDIGLPGMSGYDVARAIRADPATSGVHLVALTGYALPEDLERSSEAGFQAHLAKPPALHKLEEVIARLGADAQP